MSEQHNHIRKIAAMVDAGEITLGRIHELDIAHDDWCGFLTTGSRCDCDPEIRHTPPERQILKGSN